MTTMRLIGDPGSPDLKCEACGEQFTLMHEYGYTTLLSFCPFCGGKVADVLIETTEGTDVDDAVESINLLTGRDGAAGRS